MLNRDEATNTNFIVIDCTRPKISNPRSITLATSTLTIIPPGRHSCLKCLWLYLKKQRYLRGYVMVYNKEILSFIWYTVMTFTDLNVDIPRTYVDDFSLVYMWFSSILACQKPSNQAVVRNPIYGKLTKIKFDMFCLPVWSQLCTI